MQNPGASVSVPLKCLSTVHKQHCEKQRRESEQRNRRQILQIQTKWIHSRNINYDKGINHKRSTKELNDQGKQRLDGITHRSFLENQACQ